MDTTRALVSGEPMEMEEATQAQGANPLLVMHLLLQGRYWLAILLAIAGAATGAVLGYKFTKRTWSSSGMIHVKPVLQPILFHGQDTLPPYDGYVQTQIILLKSQGVVDSAMVQPAWRDVGNGNSPEASEGFRGALDISRDGEMITVKFSDLDPNVASAGVKAIIASYTDMYINNDAENSAHQLKQLESLRDSYLTQLKTMNDNVNQTSGGAGATAIQQRYEFKNMEANTAEAAWSNTKRQLDQWKAMHDGAATEPGVANSSTKPAEPVTPEWLVQHDDNFATLVKERDARKRQLDEQLAAVGPNNPAVVPLMKGLALCERDMADYIKNWKPPVTPTIAGSIAPIGLNDADAERQLTLAEKTQAEQFAAARDEATKLGQIVSQISAINFDRDQVQSWLDSTKLKIEQISVEAAQSGRITVISNGDRPMLRDMRVQMAGAAGFGGGLLGFGIVLLLGLMDRRLRTIDQARMSLKQGMRVLGMLPSLPKNIEDPGAAAFAALCVHHIRMLLQVMPRMDSHPAIAVTSPSPGDGKTSLTLSLALSFAASGKSTLLIDCDIVGAGLTRRINAIIRRRIGQILIRESLITPAELREALGHAQRSGRKLGEVLVDEGYVDQEQLTRALAMQAETSVGLLDVMRGEVLEECVADTGIARLWILPVGSALAEHGATISPEGFRAVLEQARKRFDVILVDTGPIPGSIESSVAASQVDGVVLCVSRGEQGPLVRRASEHLSDLGARALGIVFNRAKPEDFSSSYGSMSSPSIPSRVPERPGVTDRAAFGPVASAVANTQSKSTKE